MDSQRRLLCWSLLQSFSPTEILWLDKAICQQWLARAEIPPPVNADREEEFYDSLELFDWKYEESSIALPSVQLSPKLRLSWHSARQAVRLRSELYRAEGLQNLHTYNNWLKLQTFYVQHVRSALWLALGPTPTQPQAGSPPDRSQPP